jgi:hypothetical protein
VQSTFLGCNYHIQEDPSVGKANGLSLEIAPNIATVDSELRQLLCELGLSRAHPGVVEDLTRKEEKS